MRVPHNVASAPPRGAMPRVRSAARVRCGLNDAFGSVLVRSAQPLPSTSAVQCGLGRRVRLRSSEGRVIVRAAWGFSREACLPCLPWGVARSQQNVSRAQSGPPPTSPQPPPRLLLVWQKHPHVPQVSRNFEHLAFESRVRFRNIWKWGWNTLSAVTWKR